MRTLKNIATGKLTVKDKVDWKDDNEKEDKDKTKQEKGKKDAKTKEN